MVSKSHSKKEIDEKQRLNQLASNIREKFNAYKFGELEHTMKMERKFKPLVQLQEKSKARNDSQTKTEEEEEELFCLKRGKNGKLSIGTKASPGSSSDSEKTYSEKADFTKPIFKTGVNQEEQESDPDDYDSDDSRAMPPTLRKWFDDWSGDDIPLSYHKNDKTLGKGLWMKVIKPSDKMKTSYTYWDNPNELVDRLVLLNASREAGNTNVVNEINSIVEELREAGYISSSKKRKL